LALDRTGNLYIADGVNNRIRKVSANGIITTVAGNGTQGYSGDAGPAINSQLNEPAGLTIDRLGNLYIADAGNNCIRKVSPAGMITTIAGNGTGGYSGDGGPAVKAQLKLPQDVAVDVVGNLYIADNSNHRIRKVSPAGMITTIAGNGTGGYSGDGGLAINAQLRNPWGVAVDAAGNVYVADSHNNAIRRLKPTSR
jgi:sugar lactone lactonase YvrE